MSLVVAPPGRARGLRGIVLLLENPVVRDHLREALVGLQNPVVEHRHGDLRHYLYVVDEEHLPRLPGPFVKVLFAPARTEARISLAASFQCLGIICPQDDPLQLKATVECAQAVGEAMLLLEKANTRLLRKLRERKTIALAKEVLQKRYRIDEEEAYQRLRREACQTRRSLGEVAAEVLLRHE